VWLRHAGKEGEKFWLVQGMQSGVRYAVKHSGEFLYKMSNEGDKVNFKISKIRVPERVRMLAEGETVLRIGGGKGEKMPVPIDSA